MVRSDINVKACLLPIQQAVEDQILAILCIAIPGLHIGIAMQQSLDLAEHRHVEVAVAKRRKSSLSRISSS